MSQVSFRGLVLSRYRSISDFARALGWSRSKTTKAVDNLNSVTIEDFQTMMYTMGITDRGTILSIFLDAVPTKLTATTY